MENVVWLFQSWRVVYPSLALDASLTVIAVLCGIILGSERQRHEKAAGLRTLSLVCLGSAIFTMISFAFTTTTGDSGRVAAQIVTGIGFLGAGVILHGRRIVSGVTTAAIIWVAAAIGMVVGAGYVIAGLGLSLLVNRLLVGIAYYETHWHPDLRNVRVILEFTPKGGLTRIRLERVLVEYNLVGASEEWMEFSNERGRLTLNLKLARVHLYELLSELTDVPEVLSIEQRGQVVKAEEITS